MLTLTNQVSNLSRLTVVVPTYERHAYISRQVEFWARTDAHLLVLDGSANPHTEVSKFESCDNVAYVHAPVSIEERLGLCNDLITTEYCSLLSDDEFFLPFAVESAVAFLDENIDYSSCKGTALGFGWDGKNVYGQVVYPMLHGYGVHAKDGSERMREHMDPYQMASLWSVQRAKVFFACTKAISCGPSYSSAAAGEMQVSLISAYLGKIKVLDQLMWLRSFENKNIWWSFGRLSICDWWEAPILSHERQRFVNSIIEAIALTNSQVLSSSDVRSAVEVYVDGQRPTKSISWMASIRHAVRVRFSNETVNWLKNILKMSGIVGGSLKPPSRVHLSDFIESKENSDSTKRELRDIYDLVSRFHSA